MCLFNRPWFSSSWLWLSSLALDGMQDLDRDTSSGVWWLGAEAHHTSFIHRHFIYTYTYTLHSYLYDIQAGSCCSMRPIFWVMFWTLLSQDAQSQEPGQQGEGGSGMGVVGVLPSSQCLFLTQESIWRGFLVCASGFHLLLQNLQGGLDHPFLILKCFLGVADEVRCGLVLQCWKEVP